VTKDIEDIFIDFYKEMAADMKKNNKILKKAKGNEKGDFDFEPEEKK